MIDSHHENPNSRIPEIPQLPESELKVKLNLSHANKVLQEYGYLGPDDFLETLSDPQKIAKIAEIFTLVPDEDGKHFAGVEIQLLKLGEIVHQADANDLSKEKRMLYYITQESGQQNYVANSLLVLNRLSAPGDFQEPQRRLLTENIRKFAADYQKLNTEFRVLTRILGMLEDMGKAEGLKEEDYASAEVPKEFNKETYKDQITEEVANKDDRTLQESVPSTKNRVAAVRSMRNFLRTQLDQAQGFIMDSAKVGAIRSKAAQAGITEIPDVFKVA